MPPASRETRAAGTRSTSRSTTPPGSPTPRFPRRKGHDSDRVPQTRDRVADTKPSGDRHPSPLEQPAWDLQLEAEQVAGGDAGGGAAEVDDQRRALEHALDVEAGVDGHDDRHVAVVEDVVKGLRREPELRQLRHEVVVVRDARALVGEQADDLERRRLAQVGDPALVGDAEDADPRSADRLAVLVERARDLLDAEVRHPRVNLARELDELGPDVELARAPGQVERI